MINVTVINIKSLMKYLAGILILVIGISCTRFFYSKSKNNISFKIADVNLVKCLDATLPAIKGNSDIKRFEDEVTSRGSNLKRMLGIELPIMNNLIVDGEENENIKTKENESIEEKVEVAKTDVNTQTIEENNITPKYNLTFGSVKVKNESDKEITEETLMPNITLENNKDIVIFHTHTCESYTPSEKFNYEMTGSYRTTDLNYTVSRVGDELEKHLSSYGYNVTHNKTYHDYPAYSGSYGRSLTTVQNILQNGSSAQMVIDLHRDAVGSNSNYAPSVKIGDETAAQMMFVIGTDGGGLQHLNWQQNLKFAVKLQEKANELYPRII
ncbi:MAG: hypothetical protein HFJ57_00280 [Clostridia bacterium]|nr:hypothetical protein [Clostridia bacterium]